MGRNIFQSDAPRAMMHAIHGVVHDGVNPQAAYDLFLSQKHDESKTV
jgi:putative autoinducer-2 (AI-2) aldolase